MLIDIFARRYDGTVLKDSLEPRDSRLQVQAFRILAEDIYPYYRSGKEDSRGVSFWTDLHSRLSRELGVQELSKRYFPYTTRWNGQETTQMQKYAMVKVCENWLMQPVVGSPDEHVKERLSLIELGFREREGEINVLNAQPVVTPASQTVATFARSSMRVAGNVADGVRAWRATQTATFRASVEELNARFRQAGYALNYHNGFIQILTDDLIQRKVETPFWAVVATPEWSNVDLDMKEALDLRDSDGRDPAFYAARALESTIKIISDRNGWTTGNEKGAHNFIDNLGAKAHAFIAPWEATSLKEFFTHVRNPIGHGPGNAQMPALSRPQTEWALEFSMSWIKNLISRL